MRKILTLLLMLGMTLTLISCRINNNETLITAEQISDIFPDHQIILSEPSNASPNSVFIRAYNEVTPETYTSNGDDLISIYIYDSSKNAIKGLERFEEQTAAADLVQHSKYQIANVLMFCVPVSEKSNDHILAAVEDLKSLVEKD